MVAAGALQAATQIAPAHPTMLLVGALQIQDGQVHQSLSAEEMLYLTVAYDWLLFGHLVKDRLGKGEEIFLFAFHFLSVCCHSAFQTIFPMHHGIARHCVALHGIARHHVITARHYGGIRSVVLLAPVIYLYPTLKPPCSRCRVLDAF